MENVWEKLKALKGRSWTEAKDVLNRIKDTGSRLDEIVVSYKINSETLAEEDREIYGVCLKEEPFYLERCKSCSRLLKPSVLSLHNDLHHKRNSNNTKKTSFISPSKKKYSRKGNKSTSEDDSESVISSETPSPAVDLQENSLSNLDSSGRDDGIDIISVEELPSEDSKPPTPGPQDLYEEFAVPNTDDVSNAFSSTSTSDTESTKSFSNSKSLLKLKISTTKERDPKTQSTTSLLEAHLLSNTKYNASDTKYRNTNFKFNATQFPKTETQTTTAVNPVKNEESESDTWKNSNLNLGSPKLKTETKISIPISVLPQNVRIIGSLKKNGVSKSTSLLKNSAQKSSNDSKDKLNYSAPSSPFSITTSSESIADSPVSEVTKIGEKVTLKLKKNKRSKGKNRSTKNIEYDPNKHCGVLIDENRRCMRSLTCKTHLISLRRAVEGRSKEFDKLLADHRASKELLKEQERVQTQNMNLSEPIISLPMLTPDKLTGNTIHISSANNESEIIKIRVPNIITNPELARANTTNHVLSNDNNGQKNEPDATKKIAATVIPSSNTFSVKANNVKIITPLPKSEPESQLYKNDIKISFVCSDMLYKVGGLLYMDRSRQAVRKCMDPLITKDANKTEVKLRRSNRKISDLLQPLKTNAIPVKLNVLNEEDAENVPIKKENDDTVKMNLNVKVSEEIERMKNVLASSCKILNNISADENTIKKFKMSRRLKRKCGQSKNYETKKIKQEMSDENYDINTLLSFDKNVTKNDPEYPVISADRFTFEGVAEGGFQDSQSQGNLNNISNMIDNIVFLNADNTSAAAFNENDTAQLLQTFKELENEICNSVGNNMPNLYATQAILPNTNNTFIDYINTNANATSVPNNVEFKENCDTEFKVIDSNIPNFDENIAKNYSLIEEYCKSIASEELFLDDKTNFEFYENGELVNGSALKGNRSNEIIVVNESVFNNNEHNADNLNRTANDDPLNFDTHILNTYLSSISAAETSTQSIGDMNFAARQFDLAQVEPQDNQTLAKETVYEDIITLNKQFQDNTAVKIDQPSTPAATYTKADSEEVLKWLF